MPGYQVGDRVRVVIEDATVHGHHGGAIGFIIGRDSVGAVPAPVAWLDPTVDGVTITRRAPQPQAGDVWQLADGEILQFFLAGGVLEADDPHDSGCSIPATDVDLAGAEQLFRLPAEAPLAAREQNLLDAATPEPEPARMLRIRMLRRFQDREGDKYAETAPGSGRYHLVGTEYDCTGNPRCIHTREWAERTYGPLVDLDPIPPNCPLPLVPGRSGLMAELPRPELYEIIDRPLVTAMQWQPDNLAATGILIGWLMAAGLNVRHPSGTGASTTLAFRCGECDRPEHSANPGDWVIKGTTGHWFTWPADEFGGVYRPLTYLTPPAPTTPEEPSNA